jgi:hypothetical protein
MLCLLNCSIYSKKERRGKERRELHDLPRCARKQVEASNLQPQQLQSVGKLASKVAIEDQARPLTYQASPFDQRAWLGTHIWLSNFTSRKGAGRPKCWGPMTAASEGWICRIGIGQQAQ